MEEVTPKVIKRDGREVVFNEEKIKQAIEAAMKKTEAGVDTDLINRIVTNLKNSKIFKSEKIEVEQIQDFIENELMKSSRKEVAKEYILYREERSKIRRYKGKLMKAVASKLNAKAVVNQNANVDENSFGGRMGEAMSVVMKDMALNELFSKKSRENHLNNEIYIHDLDHAILGDHNCYVAGTQFITDKGVVDFTMLKEGEKVNVIDRNGEWREATVKKYGRQYMYKLTFDSGYKTKKTVVCTRNHRWILKDGTFTDNIQIGDELIQTPEIRSNYKLDNFYWSLGFVIGDGCDVKKRSKDRSRYTSTAMKVRLCGDKVKYIDRFLDCGWVINEYFDNGDKTVSYRKGTVDTGFKNPLLDTELWRILPAYALCSLFDGYISADGHFNSNGNIDITTSDERVKKLIETVAPLAGYHIWSMRTVKNSTNFKKDRTLYCYRLVKKQSSSRYWKLVSIDPCGERIAWCVEEPVTHSFTLQGCMVTGNCLSCPIDDLLAKGFTTRQTDIRPAGSINTAFQLVAVIFQIQSLQQFGGVSATHIDHSMVPYVRKSFYKHYKDGMTFIEEKEISSDLNDTLSIEDGKYKENSKVYKYALSMTEKELKQATEGLYHNLNN